MSVDAYAPNSQSLTFLEDDAGDLIGADTQGDDYDFTDFTLPSQTQSQTQATSQVDQGQSQLTPGISNGYDAVVGITQAVSELQFEEDDEEAYYMKDLPKHACS